MKTPSTLRVLLASFTDTFIALFLFGYLVAYGTGNLTKEGLVLKWGPSLLSLSLIATYYVLMKRFFGATLGQKLLGIGSHKNKR